MFTGLENTRAFKEFRLLHELKSLGLPVPAPVAAYVRRRGFLVYSAAILIERIPNSVPWPNATDKARAELWRKIGSVIRRFHDAGLYHADLNCDNVLVATGEVYLIDFDKCEIRLGVAGRKAPWMESNLARLKRSVEKRLSDIAPPMRAELWESLKEGYSP